MQGTWIRRPKNDTSIVFVHGILSNGETCWKHKNGTYWPKLLESEPKLGAIGIYVYTYETGLFSGSYSLNDVVDDFKERFLTLDKLADSQRIVFVCHSMGGIVVRKFLVERVNDLIDRSIEVGLFLVASPSVGSTYANWLMPFAKFMGNLQADALRFTQGNTWLNDLDKEFLNLKESRRLKLKGKELIEDKFVILSGFWRKQVVEPFSAARFFGEPYKVPASDHFSIAKPKDAGADQHRLLLAFIKHMKSVAVTVLPESHQDMEHRGAPRPQIDPCVLDLEMEHGTMSIDSLFYVRRPADDKMDRQLKRVGTTTIVKGARQMGKSSLLVRTAAQARNQDLRVCYIDFQGIDESILNGFDTLLVYLMNRLARDLKTTCKPQDYWDENLGRKDCVTEFIEYAVLADNDKPVILLLDEADRVFQFIYRNDFFALLRFWTNRRATNSIWDRFNLVLAHSTDPVLWIDDINQSPFNVGDSIVLTDFDPNQFSELSRRYPLTLSAADLVRLRDLIGGHPYLARQAFFVLASTQTTLNELEQTAVQSDGPFGDHLRRLAGRLSRHVPLRKAVLQILNGRPCDDEHSFQRLSAAGLVVGASRLEARLRCRLYEDFFRANL